MPANRQPEEVVNGASGSMRGAARRASPTLVHLASRILTIGDLVLAQTVGIPGARACCEVVSCWWGYRIGRRTTREEPTNTARQVAPASATAVRDRERS